MNDLLKGACALFSLSLAACAQLQTSASPAPTPGAPKSASTQALGIGAAVLQDTTPVDQINSYLNGFHFVHQHRDKQEEAHHYCSQLTEEFIQCAIYDSNGKDAKLIGIEHIVSNRLFQTLPRSEQALWHPHNYEVKSGLLIAPGLPEAAEHAQMEKLVGTWGKTWHVWHTKTDQLPLGQASLMMGFTADGQIHPELVEGRDRRFGISTAEERRNRQDIPDPGLKARQ